MKTTDPERHMTNLPEPARTPAVRFAAPAALLLLTAGIFVYAYRGANADDPPPPMSYQSVGASQEAQSPAVPPAAPLAANRVRAAAQPDSAVFPDLATGLAKLHRGIATAPVQAAKRDQAIAQLDSRYQAESIDPVWSATSEKGFATASASQVMAQAGFHPQDVSTDCRSHSCRISARFHNSGEARDWADRLLTQMAGTIAQAKVAVVPQDDGSFEVRVYGTRRSS
jgi:hypothetical protein